MRFGLVFDNVLWSKPLVSLFKEQRMCFPLVLWELICDLWTKTFVLKQQSTHKECFHLCSLLTKKAIKSMKSSWKINKSRRKVEEKCLKSQQKCEKSHQKWISKWNSRKVKKWPVRKKATLLKVVHQNRSNDPTKSPKTRHLCGCN